MLLPFASLLLIACHGTSIVQPSDSGAGSPAHHDPDFSDTGFPIEDVGETDPPADDSAWIFTLDAVWQVDIQLSSEGIRSLNTDPWSYVSATVTFEGDTFEDVGVRLKGRIGSYRTLSQKAGFKVNFNEYGASRTLGGLEKISLNNMVQDYSMVHDRTAYLLYRAVGIPAPRLGYVWVRVNDEDYGLYTVMEAYDDVFLKRNYDDPDGNLYDGDYYYYDNGSYTMLDFYSYLVPYFQQDEGEDVGFADLYAISDALDDHAGRASFFDALNALVDMEQHTTYWATEIWVGQYDGYAYNKNNYRVYFDPSDGRADMFPWDHDWAFYSATPITSPQGRLTCYCKADATCHTLFYAALETVCDTADTLGLVEEVQAAAALINPYAQQDPRKEYSFSTIQSYQASLVSWIQTRSQILHDTSGL